MQNVVPLVGTWIEIPYLPVCALFGKVVPLVGTWIEIGQSGYKHGGKEVVPLVGTWIEILDNMIRKYCTHSRSPRGNVD